MQYSNPRKPRLTCKKEGVILRTYPAGDSDLILRILTKNSGKVSVIARGARSGKKRNQMHPETFDRALFEYATSSAELKIMRSVSPLVSYATLRTDLDRLTTASFLCEVADALILDENGVDSTSYEALTDGLGAIAESTEARGALKACYLSLVGLLSDSGFFELPQNGPPSANNLKRIIAEVETVTERKFRSKQALLRTIQSVINQAQRAA